MSELLPGAASHPRLVPPPQHSINLSRVPLPLAGNDRYQWRLLSVLVALAVCRGTTATVEQLHTLVWALRDERNAEVLTSAWNRNASGGSPLRGYEPDLIGTLRVAQADGLINQASNGRQQLTQAGIRLLSAFREAEGSLGTQEAMIASLSPISTAAMWRRLGGTT
jgi:hypothetical protein